LIVGEDGVLKLDPALKKNAGLGFTYKYLSLGQITSFDVDESGELAWTGYIKPSVPFINKLDVSYSKGVLSVTKGLKPGEPVIVEGLMRVRPGAVVDAKPPTEPKK